jgi:hypothetical protein
LEDAYDGPDGASIGRRWCHTVSEDLVVVLILLVLDPHFSVLDCRWWRRMGNDNPDSLCILEDEVLGYEGD